MYTYSPYLVPNFQLYFYWSFIFLDSQIIFSVWCVGEIVISSFFANFFLSNSSFSQFYAKMWSQRVKIKLDLKYIFRFQLIPFNYIYFRKLCDIFFCSLSLRACYYILDYFNYDKIFEFSQAWKVLLHFNIRPILIKVNSLTYFILSWSNVNHPHFVLHKLSWCWQKETLHLCLSFLSSH